MVFIYQRSKEMRLYNLVWNLTISYPGLKAVSSNSSPALLAEGFVVSGG
jgi:hypothetical protein